MRRPPFRPSIRRARRDRQGAPRARVVLQESDGTGAPQSDAGERGGERVVMPARERRQRRVLKRRRFLRACPNAPQRADNRAGASDRRS